MDVQTLNSAQANIKEWNRRLAMFLGAQPVRNVAPDGAVTMNLRKLRYVVSSLTQCVN
jgi:hypothetical protein